MTESNELSPEELLNRVLRQITCLICGQVNIHQVASALAALGFRLKKVEETDRSKCPHCGKKMRRGADIESLASRKRIRTYYCLDHGSRTLHGWNLVALREAWSGHRIDPK